MLLAEARSADCFVSKLTGVDNLVSGAHRIHTSLIISRLPCYASDRECELIRSNIDERHVLDKPSRWAHGDFISLDNKIEGYRMIKIWSTGVLVFCGASLTAKSKISRVIGI